MKAICTAMAEAFAEFEGATKAKPNPAFRSKYADLPAVIDAVKPALVKHGLFFTQESFEAEGGVCVETVIHHASGEEIRTGKLFVPANKRDAHGYGSALTYARRYSLMTAFGVPAEDDDGNAAVSGTIDDAQWGRLVSKLEAKQADAQKFCAYMKVRNLKEIRAADFSRAMEALDAKADPKPVKEKEAA
jgi:hypothetical protein